MTHRLTVATCPEEALYRPAKCEWMANTGYKKYSGYTYIANWPYLRWEWTYEGWGRVDSTSEGL